ncbi:MAG: hypothetical protein AB7V39_29440 [Nitrospiraceae bacterium]
MKKKVAEAIRYLMSLFRSADVVGPEFIVPILRAGEINRKKPDGAGL